MNAALNPEWRIAEQDRARAAALGRAVGVPPVVAHLLMTRGVDSPDAASGFLNPSVRQLSEPFLLTDMQAAVDRIRLARAREEHIRVFGDYDVDGIAATALLYLGLRRFGVARVSHGMPQRLTEGYGINVEHVEAARRDGVSLLITVDNGVRAYAAAQRARELGIDLIVTDHHAVDGPLPDALAVINPKREPPSHPAANLCGAGVAFKLSEAINGTKNDLDFAALGTVADIVPLRGENRVIVALGLRHMAKYARTGLEHLAAVSGHNVRDLRSRHLGFHLAPRMNAAGRIGDGAAALRLLLTESGEEARRIAQELNHANEERRTLENAIFEDAIAELAATFSPTQRSVVLMRHGWHAGVIGIVATRLQARYYRPVVLIAMDEGGVGKGSARGISGFDTVAAFAACQQHCIQYGGHRAAAGCALREDQFHAFREAFEVEAGRQLGTGDISPALEIDGIVAFSEIDGALMNALARLEPFGHMNPTPVFCTCGAEVVPGSPRLLNGGHLRFSVRQADTVFEVVGFGWAGICPPEEVPPRIDLAFAPELNTWRGETSIQLMLKGIREAVR